MKKSICYFVLLIVTLSSCGDDKGDEGKGGPNVTQVTFKPNFNYAQQISKEYVELINENVAETFTVTFTSLDNGQAFSYEAKWNTPIKVNMPKGQYWLKAFGESKTLEDDINCTIMSKACFANYNQIVSLQADINEISLQFDLTCALIIVPDGNDYNRDTDRYAYKCYSSEAYFSSWSGGQGQIEYSFKFARDEKHCCSYAFTKDFYNRTKYQKMITLSYYDSDSHHQGLGTAIRLSPVVNGHMYLLNQSNLKFETYDLNSPFK